MQTDDNQNKEINQTSNNNWPPLTYLAKATVTIVLTGVLLYLIYEVKNIIILIVIAAVIAIGLEPMISTTMKVLRIKRWVTVALAIFMVLVLITLFLLFIVPPLVHQIADLSTAIPNVLSKASQRSDWLGQLLSRNEGNIQNFIASLPSQIVKSFGTIVGFTGQIGGFFINVITVFVLTLFFIYQIPGLPVQLSKLFIPDQRQIASATINKMIVKIGSFVSGNLITSFICALVTYIALLIMGVPYSIPLAMWAGLTDLIPQIGAFLGALPAVIIAFYISPVIGIAVISFFLIYQQVENFFITPKVMQKAVNLSPASVLIATLIGGDLAGIVGVLLALPVTAVLKVLFTDIWYPHTIGKFNSTPQSSGK